MVIKRIEDFIAWQHARELERRVVAFTATAPASKDFRFCDDIRRSSASAPRNMAEGFGRFWPAEFAHKLHIAVGELRETLDHLEKALESHYISDAEHLEMFGLGDGAIGAAVKFIEYLEAAGPDWKKAFLARRREAYRARRTLGTPNPAGQNRLVPGQPIENNPRNPNKPENSTRNANVNENENKNPHQNAYQNPNPNKNENGNENENRNENGNPNQNANPNENYNANENQNVNPNGHPEP